MPRAKGIRLWLEPAQYKPNGTLEHRAGWVIRDGSRKIRTGCAPEDREGAERKLFDHQASRYQIPAGKRHPSEILVNDVLNLYLQKAHAHPDDGGHAEPKETSQRVLKLSEFWSPYTLADVTGDRCREYVTWRTTQPVRCYRPEKTGTKPRLVTRKTARRELQDLSAAIAHHRREGLCSELVAVWLPAKGEPRVTWLTRSEAARLIWAAWRAKQIMRDKVTVRDVGKHIARFILVGIYSGTRHAAICTAAFQQAIGRGYVDLDRGVFHRLPRGAKATKKAQTPVRIAPRLLAHLRRWHRLEIATRSVIEWNGKPVRSVRKGFASAVKAAEFEQHVTPHVLRHTSATWMMQRGVPTWEAAGFLGMTEETLRTVYGHHHPDFQREAAAAFGGAGPSGTRAGQINQNKTRQTPTNITKIR